MKILLVFNDPPYGTEPTYNGLRLATALLKADKEGGITVFMMGDAVISARRGQKTSDGYYNLEHMLKRIVAGKGVVLLCGKCMDARGMIDDGIMNGSRRSTMDELTAASMAADRVLVF